MKINHLFLNLLAVVCCKGMLMANPAFEQNVRIPESLILQEAHHSQISERQDEEEKIQIEVARTLPTEQSVLASNVARLSLTNEASVFTNSMSTAGGVSFISYPGTYHSLGQITGKDLMLDDGSWWNIYPGDFYETHNWITDNDINIVDVVLGVTPDKVVVTVNPDYPVYSYYQYHLTNQQTGKYVRVSMLPYNNSNILYTRYIYSHIVLIDALGRPYVQLTLDDGSVWNTLTTETQCLSWHVGDIVTVGINTNSNASYAPNIFVNVQSNNNGTVSCVLYYK